MASRSSRVSSKLQLSLTLVVLSVACNFMVRPCPGVLESS